MPTAFRQLILVLLLFGVQSPSYAQQTSVIIKGKVTRIIDGDTFELLVNRTSYKIRMNAIDAPERGQAFYQVSKQALADQCFNKSVSVKLLKKDMYKRWLGDLYNEKGVYLNGWMVARGYAWQYRYSTDKGLAALQETARKQQLGLWSQTAPLAPWLFRSAQKKARHTWSVR